MEDGVKSSKLTVFCIAVSLFVLVTGTAFTQDEAVTVGSIMKAADVSLNDEQVEKLKAFKLGGDMQMFRELGAMFSDEQTKALKETLGVMQGFGGGEQVAHLFTVVLFENEGCPFTESQIAELKKIDFSAGPGTFEEMQEIYNDKQNAVMEEMFSSFQ